MTVSVDNDLNAVSGGGATVGGNDTEVQFNDGGTALGGDAGLTYNKTSNVLTNTGGNIVNTQAVATTSTDGVVLQTSETATAGNQKYSPRLRLQGSGWKTNATAAAQVCDWSAEVQPVQGAANPTSRLIFANAVNGGSYSHMFGVDSVNAALLFQDAAGVYPFARPSGGNIIWGTMTGGSYTDNVYIDIPNAQLKLKGANGGIYFGAGDDLVFYRAGAANLNFGSGPANPPVAQTLSVQAASGTDTAGAAWTFKGSLGTGAGTPGTIVFQTGATLGTGTTLQTATTRLTIAETRLTAAVPVVLPSYTVAGLPTGAAGMVAFVTDANATTFASVVAGGGANGVPVYHDGTNWRIG